ncbi:Retrovirus-related Pol polyprotein from transposon gypsy, partial [Mucuna pruriens]
MNRVLRSLIGKCVLVYFDYNLIYSAYLYDHLLHVKIIFLDSIVGSHGVKVDEEKVKAIQDWPTPKNMWKVRRFHGLASFYIRFERDFRTLTTPLNEILKKCWVQMRGESRESLPSLKGKAHISSHSCYA